MSRAIVRTEVVSKIYRLGSVELHALRSVSLSIEAGEMLAVMGPSGSGKSSLLNILGTLDRPTSGRYFLDGEAVEDLDEEELSLLRSRKIGFVFQAFNLLPRETALANVELPMLYAGVRASLRRERALHVLARVGLADRAHHLPNQLSGGQQQRVSLARALVNEPLLLLADEPTGALDSNTSRQVMELFSELHRERITIVIVTHDAAVAAYASRVVTFNDGVVQSDVQSGAESTDALAEAGLRPPRREPIYGARG